MDSEIAVLQPGVVANRTAQFRVPDDLAVTPTQIGRALVVGSCFSEGVSHHIHRVFEGAASDHVIYNFVGEMPESPPRPISDYAFQLVMLPLRTVMPETMFMALAWDDTAAFENCFQHSRQVLVQLLDGALAYNERHGLTSFVANFLCPQANSMGRLLPANDLRNPTYYVRCLNDFIADYVTRRQGVHLLDIDAIACSIGRSHLQDDVVTANSHGTYISDWDWLHDQKRLHPPRRLGEVLDLRVDDFILALWTEVAAMYRTLRQQDSVKIVICDLDDTLWRGVVAEDGVDSPALIEGWPLGLIEALTFLRRRGILLAIASKNDEARIRALWDHTVGNRLPLSQFAVIRINWESKAQNVAAILREASLLPRSAVFIDDNPVERQAVLDANPGVRVLGADLYAIRRILMWAPEVQVAGITAESTRRSEMIRAQAEREQAREAMPRHEFLATLGVRIRPIAIRDTSHPRFARAFELLNKSNQFNTTGRRWTSEEAVQFFAAGGRFEAFEVTDKFTEYGLVGLAILEADLIAQYVMSCRVLGLDVEHAFMAWLIARTVDRHGQVRGLVVETDANVLARDLFAKTGFAAADGGWILRRRTPLPPPAHVQILDDA